MSKDAGEPCEVGGASAGREVGVGLAAEIAQLLGEPLRLRILCELMLTPRNVTELQQLLSAPQPTVSHHLGLLRMSNLIANRRNGKQVFYELNGRVDAADGKSLSVSIENYHVKIGATSG